VSGKGLLWLTPGVPAVSGTAAVAAAEGLSCSYVPTGEGLRFSAVVIRAHGARSHSDTGAAQFPACRPPPRRIRWVGYGLALSCIFGETSW
jgi:hypothetical protein